MFFKKRLKKKIGLALSGGGAKGIAHIAFLEVFDELEIRPSIISGTSAGAVIGAMYASGMSADQIKKEIFKLNLAETAKLMDISWKNKGGLIKGDKFVDWLKKSLKVHNFEDLSIPLKIVATDFWNGKQVILEKGNLIDAIRASVSLPGILNPVVIDGKTLIDGGVVNPVPYDIIRNKCDILVAIDTSREGGESCQKIPNIFESIFHSFMMMQTAIAEANLRYMKPDIYVKSHVRTAGLMEFHKGKQVLKLVEDDARKFKKDLNKLVWNTNIFKPSIFQKPKR